VLSDDGVRRRRALASRLAMGRRLRKWAVVIAVVSAAIAGWLGCSSLLGIPGDVTKSTDSGSDAEGGALDDVTVVDGTDAPSGDAGVDGTDAGAKDAGDAGVQDAGVDADAGAQDASSDLDAADASDAVSQDATGDVEGGGNPLVLEGFFGNSVDFQPPDGGPLTTQITTQGPNRLLVALAVWAADHMDTTPVTISTAGLTWQQRVYETFPAGASGAVAPGGAGVLIWSALATYQLTNQLVTVARQPVDYAAFTLGVYSFVGASGFGSSGGYGDDDGGVYPLTVTLDAQAAGNWIIGGFVGGIAGHVVTALPPTQWNVQDNPAIAQYGHFTAVGSLQAQAPGSVTIGGIYSDAFNVAAALEVLPGP
jgi:hypothetical protein